MPTQAAPPPTIPQIALRQTDLQDPNLTVLVSTLQKMANGTNYLLGMTGPIALYNDIDLQGHALLNASASSGASSTSSAFKSAINQTASIPSVVDLIPDSTGLFQVTAFIRVYNYAAGALSVTCSFYDDSNTQQSANLQIVSGAGAAATSITAKGIFYPTPATLYCSAQKRINVFTTSTFSANSTYAIYASIKPV